MDGNHAGVLPNLSALSLDGPWQEKKEKQPFYKKGGKGDGKGDKGYASIVLQEDDDEGELRSVTLSSDEVIQLSTFREGNLKFQSRLSQSETKWLQDTYGPRWSEASPNQLTKLKLQARQVLSNRLLPLMQKKLEELKTKEKVSAATAKFKAEHYEADGSTPKLDVGATMSFLKEEYGDNWNKWDDGSLFDQGRIDQMVGAASRRLLENKKAQLEEELQQLIDDLYSYEKHEATLLFDSFHYSKDTLNKRKAHALLRHWFNRKGVKNDMRTWHTMKELTPERAKQMKKLRVAWATSEVTKETYNTSNPPRPPLTYGTDKDPYNLMYSAGFDVYYAKSYLRDDEDTISAKGGEWVWRYMRALEAANFEAMDPVPKNALTSVDVSAEYWNESYRKNQKDRLTQAYQEFITSVDLLSGVENAKGVAYSYTVGSGKFNRYLRWPSTLVGGDPSKIPKQGDGVADATGNKFYGDVGPPDLLHRLYKLVNRCPRLPPGPPAVFLRAVRNESGLPHNLGKSPPFVEPEIGKRYLNVTFMSTSSAAPSNYMKGNLSSFYSKKDRCCMYAITALAETAVLPLVLGGKNNSQYPDEQEVVLPPGLLLAFQGTKYLNVNNDGLLTKVYFYQVERPGDVTVPNA